LTEAAAILLRRGLVAFATETVYGLGAVASDPAAVANIYRAKGRPLLNPLIVHVAGITQALLCTSSWSEAANRLAESFWPGPLSLVLKRSSLIPDIVCGGRDTVALRVPSPPVARLLIERTGQPLAAPSANRSNRLSPTRAEHVRSDLDGRIDLIIDSGPTCLGLESTVLDLTRTPFRILRPGPIGLEEISHCLRDAGQATDNHEHLSSLPHELPASPGMLETHYAPRTPAVRIPCVNDLAKIAWPKKSALIVLGPVALPDLPAGPYVVKLDEPVTAGQKLYSTLHECDALGLEVIFILLPSEQADWRAIRDRIERATRPLAG
jgi:L-threonylcarbamoyladenylate synthase